MELMRLLLSALLVFANGAYSLEAKEDPIIDEAKVEQESLKPQKLDRDKLKERLFLGGSSVMTWTSVVLQTTTVLYTCLGVVNAAATCAGRKKRKKRNYASKIKLGDATQLT